MMSKLNTKKKCLCITSVIIVCAFLFVVLQNTSGIFSFKGVPHFESLGKSIPQGQPRRLKNQSAQKKRLLFGSGGQDGSFKYLVKDSITNVKYRNTPLVKELADILEYKISAADTKEKRMKSVCRNAAEIANSCHDENCLRMSFSAGFKERVAELVTPKKFQISTAVRESLQSMAERVTGNVEFMILSAVSSNHYMAIQAFLSNVHRNVFPHFHNFSLVIYNIGLTSEERKQLIKFCQCQVVDFPFNQFPEFVSKNQCYSWKPIIIKAHIHQAKIIVWADSSVRFDPDPDFLKTLLQQAKERGIQIGNSRVVSPFRTFRSMYHFFGDEPCVYLNMFQVQATIGFYSGEFFIDRTVLEPWVSCAVTERCMCPVKNPKKTCAESDKMADAWENDQGPISYGLCHRYDQSAISLILHKLYQGYFHWISFRVNNYMSIKRLDELSYFDSLKAV